MRLFHTASEDEIKQAETTDIYFERTKQVLEAKALEKKQVIAEVTSGRLPESWPWGVFCGVEEIAHLFEGIPVNVYSLTEGTIFNHEDSRGFRVPVIRIEGAYGKFCKYETPMLDLSAKPQASQLEQLELEN